MKKLIAGLFLCSFLLLVSAAHAQPVRFWFAGYRSTTVDVQGCAGAVKAIRQAKEGGIAYSDYGAPKLYFQFDIELSGWSDADQACIYSGLGTLHVK